MKLDELRELWENRPAAAEGAGPLYHRDYWAVIRDCRLRPSEVVGLVADRFPDFAPPELVRFRPVDGAALPLDVGDEMEVDIRGAGTFRVRVVQRARASFTLVTLRGHPEVGRITFGAYRNDRRDVIFHIRSRARSSSARVYLGFLAAGEAMQTNAWTDFINRVAAAAGDGVIGYIHAETRRLRDLPPDADAIGAPTYIARAD